MNYKEITEQVVEGEMNPLIALAKLKKIKKELEECFKQVDPLALEESQLHGNKTFELMGYSFEKRSGGRMYDFKGVPSWVKAKEKLKEVENQSLQALKSYESGLMVANAEGEEVILPKVLFRKDSLIIKAIT